MNRIKLKSIVSEIIKEMIEVNPVHQKINDKLMQIAKRGFDAEEEETYKGDADKGNKILDKANPDNVAAILRGEKPMNEGEGTTNIYSKHPYIKDMLNAMINKDGTVELQIYGPQGGLPKKQTAAVPLEQFTSEYVEKQVSSIFKVNDEFKKGIKQFVDSVQLN
jgi:hypothetical protein